MQVILLEDIKGTGKIGDIVKVRVTGSYDYDLIGEVISDESAK